MNAPVSADPQLSDADIAGAIRAFEAAIARTGEIDWATDSDYIALRAMRELRERRQKEKARV